MAVTAPPPTVPVTPPAVQWKTEIVASDVNRPWSLNFVPDGRLFFTSRDMSDISALDLKTGAITTFTGNQRVRLDGEAGLLGMAIDPGFATNGWLYVCYSDDDAAGAVNRLSRFTLSGTKLINEKTLIDDMPGSTYHNGCRVIYGPDGFLYATMGDAEQPDRAQDPAYLGGKILRIQPDGAIPPDNPFGRNPVWTVGHRNPQGLAFNPVTGALWSSEHGLDRRDELNVIRRGMNYGWPTCEGMEPTCGSISNYAPAVRHYEDDSTIAISDIVFYTGDAFPAWRNQLFFVSLKTGRLYRTLIDGDRVVEDQILIDNTFGRLRDITVGPDGFIYFSTDEDSGRIIRLRPK